MKRLLSLLTLVFAVGLSSVAMEAEAASVAIDNIDQSIAKYDDTLANRSAPAA